MGKKGGGYYAVQQGRNTGVFSSWAEAKAQVDGYPGAVFKKFDSSSSAQSFVNSSPGYTSSGGDTSHSKSVTSSFSTPITNSKRFSDGDDHRTAKSHKSSSHSTRSISTSPPLKKQQYYAVANGRCQGVFSDWDSCKSQVNGYENAKYKRFDSLSEAQSYIAQNKPSNTDTPTSTYKSSYSQSSNTSKKTYYAANFNDGTSKIYTDWSIAQAAISGKQGVTYKKFDNLDAATRFTEATSQVTHSEADRARATEIFLQNNSQKVLQQQRDLPKSVIYTDGSYFPNGKAGIGVYYGPGDTRNVAEPVKGASDSYSPEVHALNRAMENISQEIDRFERGEGSTFPKYTISSDNEAAKNVMTQYGKHWTKDEFMKRKDGETLYNMTRNYLKIQNFYSKNSDVFNGHQFDIIWVKGHSGIDGNEAADQLARQGASK